MPTYRFTLTATVTARDVDDAIVRAGYLAEEFGTQPPTAAELVRVPRDMPWLPEPWRDACDLADLITRDEDLERPCSIRLRRDETGAEWAIGFGSAVALRTGRVAAVEAPPMVNENGSNVLGETPSRRVTRGRRFRSLKSGYEVATFGGFIAQPRFADLVETLFPGVEWYAPVSALHGPMHGVVGGQTVALVMGTRDTIPAEMAVTTGTAAHPAGRAATDAAKAARARGEDVYADGEGRCEVAPAAAPVASAERAVIEAAQFGASWYAYDPETGYDTFETAEEAQRAAEASLDHYRDGSPDGWHESVGEIEWGLLVPYGEARQCDVVNAEDDPTVAANGWDYRCDYRLHSVRSAAVDALAAARKGGAK